MEAQKMNYYKIKVRSFYKTGQKSHDLSGWVQLYEHTLNPAAPIVVRFTPRFDHAGLFTAEQIEEITKRVLPSMIRNFDYQTLTHIEGGQHGPARWVPGRIKDL
jgi:hypothetical protein